MFCRDAFVALHVFICRSGTRAASCPGHDQRGTSAVAPKQSHRGIQGALRSAASVGPGIFLTFQYHLHIPEESNISINATSGGILLQSIDGKRENTMQLNDPSPFISTANARRTRSSSTTQCRGRQNLEPMGPWKGTPSREQVPRKWQISIDRDRPSGSRRPKC